MSDLARTIENVLSRFGEDYDPEVGAAQAEAVEALIRRSYLGLDRVAEMVRAGREHEAVSALRFLDRLPSSWDGPSVRVIEAYLRERVSAIIMGAESPSMPPSW
ncbi:hypothetical protein GCM10010988_17350 [Cnuibacter physcomitrellae]|uniref:Uncharacterized protein n=1 Tax=Cnuibacter physcomitrellae TaxID=1619308 RepID=A0A1X9LWQ9_9MICO|nr:hypothetical protein [Cnuibacter physcomitrellae]ARJ06480.1 hypothetical protein B5808_15595 [Cnuibacter physcomitrellae]GGI38112.1 hypothetical protein GCM10010988_17350 [Cnuibacter physcomitrellae]